MWGILINHVTEGEGREREPPDKRGTVPHPSLVSGSITYEGDADNFGTTVTHR